MGLHLEVANVWNMHYGTVYAKRIEIMCEWRHIYIVAHIDFFRGIHLAFALFPYSEQLTVGQSPKFRPMIEKTPNFSHLFCWSGILS